MYGISIITSLALYALGIGLAYAVGIPDLGSMPRLCVSCSKPLSTDERFCDGCDGHNLADGFCGNQPVARVQAYTVHQEVYLTNPSKHAAWVVAEGKDRHFHSAYVDQADAEEEAKRLNDQCADCDVRTWEDY